MEKIEKLIKQEIDKGTKKIQDTNKYLANRNKALEEQILRLNDVISDLKGGDLFSKCAKNINETNIGEFLKFIFSNKDNPDSNNEVTKAPVWFLNLIVYWSNKDLLLQIYDLVGIKYPQWAIEFRIPYEWNQEEIDVWFQTLGNHYVCNGAIYENNLGFWLSEMQGKTPIQSMRRQYSDIPWNLFLKNPLLLEEDNFSKVVNAISDGNHGIYFSMLPEYQKLSVEQIERLAIPVSKNRYISEWNSTSRKALNKILSELPLTSTIWDTLFDDGKLNNYNGTLPDRIKKKIIEKIPTPREKFLRMLDSKLFTEQELQSVSLDVIRNGNNI